MNEFYVEKLADANEAHIVHRGNCPSLPPRDKLHYIGERSSTAAPLREAEYFWYSKSAPCPHCMAG